MGHGWKQVFGICEQVFSIFCDHSVISRPIFGWFRRSLWVARWGHHQRASDTA